MSLPQPNSSPYNTTPLRFIKKLLHIFNHSGEKWGKMGENGGNCEKFWMLDGKMGNFGAEKVKKHGFDWQQGYGGGVHWQKLPRKNGEKWGNQTSPP